MQIQLAVFDVAGTTLEDSSNTVARCVADAVNAAGGRVGEADVDPVMGMPKPLAVRTLLALSGGGEVDETVAHATHEDFRRRIMRHYEAAAGVREISGATRAFKELRAAGVRVALDTGFDRETLDVILRRLGWGPEVLDLSVASDEVADGRPAPDMIHAAMRAVGVEDARAVAKIGDSRSDVEQGFNAGCGMVVAIENGRTASLRDEFPELLFVESVAEVPGLVRSFGTLVATA